MQLKHTADNLKFYSYTNNIVEVFLVQWRSPRTVHYKVQMYGVQIPAATLKFLWQDVNPHFAILCLGEINGYLVGMFLVMHCVLSTAARAKARLIISKALLEAHSDLIATLYHNV